MKRLLTGFLTVFLLVLTSNIATAQQQETSESTRYWVCKCMPIGAASVNNWIRSYLR